MVVGLPNRFELPSNEKIEYYAFVDAAGGVGGDSMVLAIAHAELTKDGEDYVMRRSQSPVASLLGMSPS
jgi:hypothetical protein